MDSYSTVAKVVKGEVRADETQTSPPPESMLLPDPSRFVLFPVKYPELFAFYKRAVASFWTVEEVDLAHDGKDWATLAPEEQEFLSKVLAFFAASDGIVNQNLVQNFSDEVQVAEVRSFYTFQAAMESIHGEMYSLLIDTYIADSADKQRLFRAVETVPCIKLKAEWALRWANPKVASFHERLVAFACVEGIFFSGSFCAIFWMKKRGKLPGLCYSNELISRDEALHCDFACALYRHLTHPLGPARVQEIVTDAVQCEKVFVLEALRVDMIGMNATLMSQYIEFVADRLLEALGAPKVYLTPNPFDWMELISCEGKTNFFEKRVGEYAKAGVGSASDAGGNKFSLDEDF